MNNIKENINEYLEKDSINYNSNSNNEKETFKGYENQNLIESNNFFNFNNSFESIKNSFYNDNGDDNSLKSLFNEIPKNDFQNKNNYLESNYLENDILKNFNNKAHKNNITFNNSIENKPKFIKKLSEKLQKYDLNKHKDLINKNLKLNKNNENEFDILNSEINSQIIKINLLILFNKEIIANSIKNTIFKSNIKLLKEKEYFLKLKSNKIELKRKNKEDHIKLDILEGIFKSNNYNIDLELNQIDIKQSNKNLNKILKKFIIQRIILNHQKYHFLEIDSDDYEKYMNDDYSIHGAIYIFEDINNLNKDLPLLKIISKLINVIPLLFVENYDEKKIKNIQNDFIRISNRFEINWYQTKIKYPLIYLKDSDNKLLIDILLNNFPLKLRKITELLNTIYIENLLKKRKTSNNNSLFYGIVIGAIGIFGTILLKKK